MPDTETIGYAEAVRLADALSGLSGGGSVAERVAALEAQGRTAGRLIRAMLRQANRGDYWKLPED
jgi:hypothetical protein